MCKCDLEEGTYNIPTIELPLKMKESKAGKISLRKNMMKKYLNKKGVRHFSSNRKLKVFKIAV